MCKFRLGRLMGRCIMYMHVYIFAWLGRGLHAAPSPHAGMIRLPFTFHQACLLPALHIPVAVEVLRWELFTVQRVAKKRLSFFSLPMRPCNPLPLSLLLSQCRGQGTLNPDPEQ